MSAEPERDAADAPERWTTLLLRTADVLGDSLDYRHMLHNFSQAAVDTVADACVVELGDSNGTEVIAASHAQQRRPVAEVARPWRVVLDVLETGKPFYAADSRMDYTSTITVPIRSRISGTVGAITLATLSAGRPPFTPEGVHHALALARMCAAAVGKARLYDEAVAVAIAFQEAALPRALPAIEGIELFARYEPATDKLLIGGDWYDVFLLPDGRVGISMGDVSGHGVAASALMATCKNALRSALIMEPDIGRALDVADYVVRTEQHTEPFATALLAILDTDAMTLRLGTAGHPGPKVWDPREGAITDPFLQRDLPLGVRNMRHEAAPVKTARLEPGGLMVFYTDGLVEYRHDIIEGEARLESALADPQVRNATNPAEALRNAVLDTSKPPDDTALLVVRVRE